MKTNKPVFHVEHNNLLISIFIEDVYGVWYGRYEIYNSKKREGVYCDKVLGVDKNEAVLMITVEALKACKNRALKDALWLEFCKFRQLELPL